VTGYRNGKGLTEKSGFQVRGHVIAAFEGVRIGWIMLGNESVNKINQKDCSFALFNILTIFESSV